MTQLETVTVDRLTCGRCRSIKDAQAFRAGVKRDARAYCDACRKIVHQKANKQRRSARRGRLRGFRAQVLEAFGGTCECPGCTVTAPEFMTVEHAFDRQDRKIYNAEEAATRPSDLWELLVKKRFPRDRYRLLCQNCKTARQHEGACPCEDLDG